MINKLAIQIREMQDLAEHWEIINPAVSASCIGWHLSHNLQVINGVVASIAASNPANYAPKQTFVKWLILLTKKIPRGKVRAPKYVVPETISKEELEEALDRASLSVLNLLNQSPKQYFTHPMFGDINTKLAARFLWIHTEHHLKIARDILK
jgi:hypothetical protein